jgi:hypothetical protein
LPRSGMLCRRGHRPVMWRSRRSMSATRKPASTMTLTAIAPKPQILFLPGAYITGQSVGSSDHIRDIGQRRRKLLDLPRAFRAPRTMSDFETRRRRDSVSSSAARASGKRTVRVFMVVHVLHCHARCNTASHARCSACRLVLARVWL